MTKSDFFLCKIIDCVSLKLYIPNTIHDINKDA